jgi:protein phosphatase
MPPSARAAHGAACVETNKIVIYGGATGSGGLASDDLFLLDLKDGVGIWNIINLNNRTPGKRYGHTLSFSKPFLVVYGGNIGEKTVNDCWILNIETQPLIWTEVRCQGEMPCPRVYHSAALCTAGSASGMIVVFGGRSAENNPLNDSWGLRRHRKGHWDWVRAPEKSNPTARYQHSGLFIGSLMIIVGGKTNNISETLPLEVFDTESSEWIAFNNIQRFRHGVWVHEKNLFIYGGFELTSPTLPTDSIYKISLSVLFKNNPNLYGKIVDLNSSTSSISSNNSAISNRSQKVT